MLDSTTKSLEALTFALESHQRYATRRRNITEVFATICWFHEVREHIGAASVAAVQGIVEPGPEKNPDSIRRWQDYRRGLHTPLDRVVKASEKVCPQAPLIYSSTLWDALRLDRPADALATALLHKMSHSLGRELLERMLSLKSRPISHPRWVRKRCRVMIRLQSLDGLAAVVISMRLAALERDDRLVREFARFSEYYLIVLGGWFYERGIAQSLGDYFAAILWPSCYNQPWIATFSANHYIANIHAMKKVWQRATAANNGKVTLKALEEILDYLES